LQPGLTAAEMDALLKDWPFKLSCDVRALYRRRNGFEDDLIQLLPNLSFLPLESALELASGLWEASAEQEKKNGVDFFPRVLLPIFTDAKNDGVLLVQGFEAETPHSPAQVVLLLQGKRLYGFEKLEDLFKAALELFKTGIYTLDQDHDTVNLADEDKARAVWRRFPLIYLENAEMSSLALEDEEEDLDDDDDDGENMLAGLLEMMGLNPEAMDPETATLEDMTEMLEVIPLEDWPEELQARYRELGGVVPVGDKVLEGEVVQRGALEEREQDE
ncbi:MAG: hypothetical protein H7095_03320, partial [Pseudopedobacter sp.]|nr:hypothetical protein [Deinococcales bacterium]